MSELFISVLNMSLTASYVILFVILVRLLLKKAPKVISYALWCVVAFRLIIPFSFESMFSLMPRNTNTAPIPQDIIYQQTPQINSGIEVIDSFVRKSLPAPIIGDSVNPLQIYTEIGSYIWVFGVIALLIYSFISIFTLKRKLKSAQLMDQNIFEAKNLNTPFVLGFIKPKIYLPIGLNNIEKSYILLHEQNHIHRKDHIIKVLAFLILSIHWFNPLVWIAFMLMSYDMELSCDEQVLKEMNEDIKKPYANSLLTLATRRHILNGSPLTFGEGSTKVRIKNVLNYRKPKFWATTLLIIIVMAVGIGLMLNPRVKGAEQISELTQENNNDSISSQITLKPTAPKFSLEQDLGVTMPELDYASDDIVIFHGYFGLFVYDLNTLQIVQSIDLKPLNCNQVQGSNYCDVSVSMDGNTLYLHPMEGENMYKYTVSSNTLQEAPYQQMDKRFTGVPIEDVIDSTSLGSYSYNTAKFDNGEYGYLHASDWRLDKLSYVRGDRTYPLFGGKE